MFTLIIVELIMNRLFSTFLFFAMPKSGRIEIFAKRPMPKSRVNLPGACERVLNQQTNTDKKQLRLTNMAAIASSMKVRRMT